MAYDFSDLRVLIADDNAPMRRIVHTILKEFGVKKIREASSGNAGLEIVRDFDPDIIFTDWNMAPMNGLEFVRLIRAGGDNIPNPFVTVIMLTANTEKHHVIQARDAGITEFLAKPVSAKTIEARLTYVIERPRPFIRTTKYFGPDRRRKDEGAGEFMDRRTHQEPASGVKKAATIEQAKAIVESLDKITPKE